MRPKLSQQHDRLSVDALQAIRRNNLRLLGARHGGWKKLAAVLGYSNGSFLVQMAGPKPIRTFTEGTACKFEDRLGLPRGWISTERSASTTASVSEDALVRALQFIASQSDEPLPLRLSPAKFAKMVVDLAAQLSSDGPAVRMSSSA